MAKSDVTGLEKLQHLRLLSELSAGKLIDQHRSAAQFLELVGEDIGRNPVARGSRLIIGKPIMNCSLRGGSAHADIWNDEQRHRKGGGAPKLWLEHSTHLYPASVCVLQCHQS
jgi:hypothetical protein